MKNFSLQLYLAMQFDDVMLTIKQGDTTLPVNQMRNAIFNCTCEMSQCNSPLFWSLKNGDKHLITNEENDANILAQRGITFSSSATSAVISIPDTVENNNTVIFCGVLHSGNNVFSETGVTLIIIGK